MKKKCLVIHEQSHIGGGQTYVNNMVRNLKSDKNLEVVVFEDKSNLKIIFYILKNRVDVIVWNIYSARYFISTLIAFILRIKNVCVVYGFWFQESLSIEWQRHSLREKWRIFKGNYQLYLEQLFIFLLMNRIVNLSQYGKEEYTKSYGFLHKENTVMYPGIEPGFIQPKISKNDAREKLFLIKNVPVILMLGRIDYRKNYHKAIEILEELSKKKGYSKAQLVFVFSSSKEANDFLYLQHIFEQIKEKKLGNRVRFFSGVSREQLILFYSAADLFLMLSEKLETFGLVTLEAISLGCPVFGIEACATPEILGKQKALFLSKDISSIVSLILDFFERSDSEQAQILTIMQNRVWKNFSWEKSIKKLLY